MRFRDLEIREATIDDLAPIFHLGETVFTSKRGATLYRTWDEYEVVGLFHSEPEFMLVAEAAGRLVGFVLGTVIEKPRTAWKYGHLLWMGVAPQAGKAGAGRRLFQEFRDRMERIGVRMLLVDTQADNREAIAFFRRQGFDNPTDHVYMTLTLGREEE